MPEGSFQMHGTSKPRSDSKAGTHALILLALYFFQQLGHIPYVEFGHNVLTVRLNGKLADE